MKNKEQLPVFLESLNTTIAIEADVNNNDCKFKILHDGKYTDEEINEAFEEYLLTFNSEKIIDYNNLNDEIKEDIKRLYARNYSKKSYSQ